MGPSDGECFILGAWDEGLPVHVLLSSRVLIQLSSLKYGNCHMGLVWKTLLDKLIGSVRRSSSTAYETRTGIRYLDVNSPGAIG